MRAATLTMNPAVDKTVQVGKVVPEKKLRCGRPRWEPGGGGINVSRALQRLGAPSVAVYPAGGPMGVVLRELVIAEDVEHRPIQISGWTRENLTVFETSSDQQYRFGMPGPQLDEHDWEQCLSELNDLDHGVRYLIASGSLPGGVPPDFYRRLGELAKRRKWRLVLDTSGEPLRRGVEAGVYLLKPNLRELGHLGNEEIESEAQQEGVAKALIAEGRCEVVVLSLGAGGALLVTNNVTERMVPPTVPIRSKVGAGDSMVAGILFGLMSEMDIRESVRYGLAAGAAAVMTPGSELCRAEDTERLFRGMRRQN